MSFLGPLLSAEMVQLKNEAAQRYSPSEAGTNLNKN